VVVVGGVLLRHLQAPVLGLADVLYAPAARQRRHAPLGEREVVGPVVAPTLGRRVGLHHPPLRRRHRLGVIVQLGVAVPGDAEVLRPPVDVQRVHVDDRQRLRQRV